MDGGSVWRIQLFGTVQVWFGPFLTPTINNRKVALLLAFLVTRSGRDVSRDTLIEILWPGEYSEIGRDRLRQTLALLNKHFCEAGGESPIQANRTTLRLDPNSCESDWFEFRSQLKSGGIEDWMHAADLAIHTFCDGLIEDWVRTTRQSVLHDLHSTTKVFLREDASPSLDFIDRVLEFFPLDEEASHAKLRSLQSSGQSTEAALFVRQYEAKLKADLGLEPSSKWKLATRSLLVEPDPLWPKLSRNLPLPADRFFGRERELTAILDDLKSGEVRVLTVTGHGGVGKTRFLLEVLNQLESSDVGEVIPFTLADFENIGQVLHALSQAFEVDLTSGAGDAFARRIGRRRILLAFDNCEHLLPGIESLVLEFVQACPMLTVLATSRMKLGILGEREISLNTLLLKEDEVKNSPALQMLTDRIQASDQQFVPNSDDFKEIELLCKALDGLPLAIELAATQASFLSVKEIRRQIEGNILTLESGSQGLSDRHTALRKTLDWGYSRLTSDQKSAMSQLSLMPSSWTIEDATAIVDQSSAIKCVQALRNLSLVTVIPGSSPKRFRILEMIRQFAREHLTPEEETQFRIRHLDLVLKRCESNYERRFEPEAGSRIEEFRSSLPDFRLAMQTVLQLPECRKHAYALAQFSNRPIEAIGALGELRAFLGQILKLGGFPVHDEGLLLAFYAHCLAYLDHSPDFDPCSTRLQELVRNEPDVHRRQFMANQLGSLVAAQLHPTTFPPVIELLRESAESSTDIDFTIVTLHTLGRLYLFAEQPVLARHYLAEAYETATKFDRIRPRLWALFHLAWTDSEFGEHRKALETTAEAIKLIPLSADQIQLYSFIRLALYCAHALNLPTEVLDELNILRLYEETKRRQHGLKLDFRSQHRLEVYNSTYLHLQSDGTPNEMTMGECIERFTAWLRRFTN